MSKLNHCKIGLNARKILIAFLAEKFKEDARRVFINDILIRFNLKVRSLYGVTTLLVDNTLEHEFTHFFHSCFLLKNGGKNHKDDIHNLHAESITLLVENKQKSYFIYPSSEKFQLFVKEQLDRGNNRFHDYSLLMAFFIGLFLMKKKYPDEFAQQHIVTKTKQKIALPFVDFKDILDDKNRPLFFKNMPPHIIELLVKILVKLNPRQFVDYYVRSATYLGIPPEYFLVTRKDKWRRTLREEDLMFSS